MVRGGVEAAPPLVQEAQVCKRINHTVLHTIASPHKGYIIPRFLNSANPMPTIANYCNSDILRPRGVLQLSMHRGSWWSVSSLKRFGRSLYKYISIIATKLETCDKVCICREDEQAAARRGSDDPQLDILPC